MSVALRHEEPAPQPAAARMTAREAIVLGAILAVGLALRLREAARTPLWFDELFTLWMAGHPLPQMLRLLAGDIHPPLPTLLVALWRAVGGDGALWLKTLPITIGMATLAVTYAFTRDVFGRRTAPVAAALLALHPMHVYFSQELRSYGLLALAVLLSAWGAWRWARDGRTRDGVLWAGGMALTMHTHYLGAVVLAFLDLWVLASLRRTPSRLAGWAWVHAGALALIAPLAGMLPGQLRLSANHWLPHPAFPSIVDHLRKVTFGAVYMVPVLAVAVVASLWPRATRAAAAFLLGVATVPLAVAFVLTHYGAHLYAARYWHFLEPVWCILFAAGLAALPPRVPRTLATAALILFAVRADVLTAPLREAVALREVAGLLAPHVRPGDLLFCADTHSLLTLERHGIPPGVLIVNGISLPYYLGAAIVPMDRRVAPDSVIAAAAAGRRWWAVRTREGGMPTVRVAALLDSVARGGSWSFDPVTVWAGRPGMLDAR